MHTELPRTPSTTQDLPATEVDAGASQELRSAPPAVQQSVTQRGNLPLTVLKAGETVHLIYGVCKTLLDTIRCVRDFATLFSGLQGLRDQVIQRGSLPSDAKNPSSMLVHRIREQATRINEHTRLARAAAPQSAPGVLPALAAHSILKWGENGSQALLVPLQCVRMVLTVEH